MAKKQEEVVEKTTEQPKVDEKVEKLKVNKKSTLKKFNQKDEVTKVDLSKPVETEEKEETKPVEEIKEDVKDTSIVEEVTTQQDEPTKDEEEPILEEVTDKVEEIAEEAEKAIEESIETGKKLPENVQKLMDFMEETGGDLEDFVSLNKDYSDLDNQTLLQEYYKKTKPHLSLEEIDFLMEDQFSYNEDDDSERDIKRKKLALKEQVANAKSHLDGLKSKYYEDIKAGSKLTSEQQKAVDFFNRYNEKSKESELQKSTFLNKTNEVFNDKFKGFEYNIGDKKFRFNVKDANNIKESQSDINNFVKKFLDKKNQMSDAKGYHKSLYTAMNADAVANHFYEQGKADALKESISKSKNINMNPRQEHSGEINAGGLKFRVLGDDSNDFKLKIKNK
jgi:hypothetical protein